MRILITVDLDDADLAAAYDGSTPDWPDMEASVAARLDEAGYFGPTNLPVRGSLVAMTDL
jgi:hypothetical protein